MGEQAKQTEMVRVWITASQRVRYNQVVTMKRDEWEELKQIPEYDLEDEGSVMGKWLDLSDVFGADDFEGIDMVVVDDAGKPVEPRDEYLGE